jgi:hypothetical protein
LTFDKSILKTLGVIHKKVGPSKCGFRIAEFGSRSGVGPRQAIEFGSRSGVGPRQAIDFMSQCLKKRGYFWLRTLIWGAKLPFLGI